MCSDGLFKVFANRFPSTDNSLIIYVKSTNNKVDCENKFGGSWQLKAITHPRQPKVWICHLDTESQPQPSWDLLKIYLSGANTSYEESKPLMEKAISRLQDLSKDNGWYPLNLQISVVVQESEAWRKKSHETLVKAEPNIFDRNKITHKHLNLAYAILKGGYDQLWYQQDMLSLFLEEIKIKMVRPALFIAEYFQAASVMEKDTLKNLEMEVSQLQQLQSRNLTLINQTSQLIESLDSKQQILLPKLLECFKSCQRKIGGEKEFFDPFMNDKLFDEQNKIYGIIPPGANMHCVSLQGVQNTIDYFNKIPAVLKSLREKINALQ